VNPNFLLIAMVYLPENLKEALKYYFRLKEEREIL
jgi:hypothetical protein